MKSQSFQIVLTPDQRETLELVTTLGHHSTIASIIATALTVYLDQQYCITYPPTRPKGGNQRKAKPSAGKLHPVSTLWDGIDAE